jgi:thioredoxin 1
MKNTIELTDANFETEVLQATQPVVVDFYADWCGPCKMLAPTLEEIAGEQAGRAKVAKLNVDTYPDIAQRYGVQAMPTLLYFRDGEVRDITLGAVGKRVVVSKLEALTAVPA